MHYKAMWKMGEAERAVVTGMVPVFMFLGNGLFQEHNATCHTPKLIQECSGNPWSRYLLGPKFPSSQSEHLRAVLEKHINVTIFSMYRCRQRHLPLSSTNTWLLFKRMLPFG